VSEELKFHEVYAARRGAIRATAYLLCGDWHLAEDLTQNAFVRLYQRWGRLRHQNGIESYLRQTLVRLWIDETRRLRHRDLVTAEPPERAAREVPGSVDAELLAALRMLGERQRACLVLRYFADLSVADTAQALGCRPGTVKSQTSRALDLLRARLVDDGIGLSNDRGSR
jgi:RNA polymerase sigma-70 factor (sigma-E family)